jgi:GTP pyrophosphokinase
LYHIDVKTSGGDFLGAVALTYRFLEALQWATWAHQGQIRKGSQTPYISHPMAVAGLVMEHGSDEDQVIAALMHDLVEDQGGMDTLLQIKHRFGAGVADIVDGCSDDAPLRGEPKKPWKERKERYLEHLAHAAPSILLVSLADKVHNLRTIVTDLREHGEVAWERFTAKKQGSVWYYEQLLVIFAQACENGKIPRSLFAEFRASIEEMRQLEKSET